MPPTRARSGPISSPSAAASRWIWEDHLSESPRPGKTVSKWGALIDGVDCFDAAFFGIPPSEAMALDPQQRLLLQESYRAFEDAGIDSSTLAGSSTGVFVGYQYSEYEQHLRRLGNADMSAGPVFSSSSPSYYLANRVSFAFDLRGPSEAINVNCASSAVAINRAYHALLNGECDTALAAGVSLNLFEGDYIASSQYGLLSSNGTSGVFDDAASGFTRGEGVGVIVLKRLEDAQRDHDRIYAVMKSCHQNYRGAARSLSEVRHESITDVLSACYLKAAVDPATVRYIEVDGYATKWADSFEFEGIKGALPTGEPGRKRCALGSVKGNIGNVEAASGVTHVIKLALALHRKVFPATISKTKVNTFIDIESAEHPLYIADKPIAFDDIRDGGEPIRAGINSFADSGTNVHILLEEVAAERSPAKSHSERRQLFVMSARNGERLEACVRACIETLAEADETDSFESLIHTAQTGREPMDERLAVVAASRGELLEKLALIKMADVRTHLGMASRDIYRGSAHGVDKNPLADLITTGMVDAQLAQAVQSGQWKQIALLWVNGVRIPWEVVWQDAPVRPGSLPCYPFTATRYWMDAPLRRGAAPEVAPSPPRQEPQRLPVESGHGDPPPTLALYLKQEAARQLHRPADEISSDKDLIDLGLSSMGIAELIHKVDKLLGIHLSPSVVFKHSGIGALAAYLEETYPQSIDACTRSGTAELPACPPTDIVVAVQPLGTRVPIFALPGAGGNALSLQQLSHALGHEQPFYCLEAVGLDGTTPPPLASVAETAALNIERMRAVQAKGPYRLLGYSNGGVVAFEMARQLLGCRIKVSSLTLLDTLCPTARGPHPVEDMVVAVFNHFAKRLGVRSDLDADMLRRVPESERSKYLYGFLCSRGIDLPRQQFIATFDAATASEHACRAYRPSRLPQPTDVVLITASNGFRGAPGDYGWGPFVTGPMRTFQVQADHLTIVEMGPVAEVAQKIPADAAKAARATPDIELEVNV